MKELYASTDIEADGRIPGRNSMLSLGTAVFTEKKELISTFEVNLLPLEGGIQDPETMEWWKKHPEAWEHCQKNRQHPEIAMPRYAKWLRSLPAKPTFVAYPAGFDFTFVYWYLIRFAGDSPFSFSALDMKSFAMALMGCDYRDATKSRMPKEWFDNLPHTHMVLDDAIEQGALFCNMLAASRRKKK